MLTMASKNSAANGSDRASAWIGKTPSSTPASRIRWMFSEALNHRSVAQTCTPNSRRRKIDDDARPQPRSSTRKFGRSEEHTSELQSRPHLVCRLLLEKKKKKREYSTSNHTTKSRQTLPAITS